MGMNTYMGQTKGSWLDTDRPSEPALNKLKIPDALMAKKLGISRYTVWRWRQKGIIPTEFVYPVKQIAKAKGIRVSFGDFFKGTDVV